MGWRRVLPARACRADCTSASSPFRSLVSALAFLALLCGAAASASAGVRADVDRDGALDTVRFEVSRGTITIAFGGSRTPQVLRSGETLNVVAVSDIDGDGDLDIVGASHAGILLWRNAGAGRFVAIRPVQAPWLRPRPGPCLDDGVVPAAATDASLADPDNHAIAEDAVDCFDRCAPPRFEPFTARTRAARAVPSESRAPPPSLTIS